MVARDTRLRAARLHNVCECASQARPMPCRDVGLSDVPETKILSAKKQTSDEKKSRTFLFPLPKTGLLSTLSVQVDAVNGWEKWSRPRMLRDLVASYAKFVGAAGLETTMRMFKFTRLSIYFILLDISCEIKISNARAHIFDVCVRF